MTETLGKALLEISTADVGFSAGLARAKAGAESLNGAFSKATAGITSGFARGRQALNRFGGALAPLGAALTGVGLAAAFTSAVRTMGDFEQAMNKVRAVSGATGSDFDALRAQARQLGATTVFSASQAADAMGFLAMAGFRSDQIMSAMPATLNLAASANIGLAESADIVSNVMQSQGMAAEKTGYAVDVLTKAFTSSNTNLVQLGEAFKYAGPVTKAFGISMEETTAALGLMGNAGIQASLAGTALRGALTRLANPTKQNADLMKSLGITAFDSSGQMRSLADILDQVRTSGATAAQVMNIFGQRAGPGMLALIGQGSDALRGLTEQLAKAGGTADKIAKIQMEGLKGQIKALQSAYQELVLTLGDTGFLSGLTSVVKGLTFWIRTLAGDFHDLRLAMVQSQLEDARNSESLFNLFGLTTWGTDRVKALEQELLNFVGTTATVTAQYDAFGAQIGGTTAVVEKHTKAVHDAAKATAGLSDAFVVAAAKQQTAQENADIAQSRLFRDMQAFYDWQPQKIPEDIEAAYRKMETAAQNARIAQARLFRDMGEQPTAVKTLTDRFNEWVEAMRKAATSSDALRGAAANFGAQAGGQIAGVGGAVAGFQQGGPWGAAAGFFGDLLLRNEKMQKLLGSLNDSLVQLVGPIADALAPVFRDLAPVIHDMEPAIRIVAAQMRIYLAPISASLRLLHGYLNLANVQIPQLADVDAQLSRTNELLNETVSHNIEELKKLPGLIGSAIRHAVEQIGGGAAGLGGGLWGRSRPLPESRPRSGSPKVE